jgi:transcriptional regulator with XRE-family HTH domain
MTTTDKELIPGVASRLRALRQEVNQQLRIRTVDEFAALIGAERNQVSNWLNAYNLPPVWMMVRLCDRFGITLDWLVRGHAGTLPLDKSIRLTARLEGEPVPPVSPEADNQAAEYPAVAVWPAKARKREKASG